ncbi:MAG TPA: V-type ATPase subunit [Gemmatimonadaceae bacterium]|nr:V-type ATPase subunit [Gemmatimonadaceae bacterium]
MSEAWGDVVARAAGLSTRLVGGDTLRTLARTPDLPSLWSSLERLAPEYLPAAERRAPSPPLLERAARRVMGARLAVLARWCGGRVTRIAPVYEAEDHRSIRAALRGAAAGAPPDERRAGLIATPSLPEAALDELTQQPTTAAVAALLAAWGHPFASAILEEAAREQPDLYTLEGRLDLRFTRRAEAVAYYAGAPFKDWVRVTLLAQGAWTAALAEDPAAALAPLALEMPATPLGALLARGGVPAADALDRATIETHLAVQRAHARRDPIGLGPVLYFVARLRAEVRDLTRIAWGIALGMPAPALAAGVVAP